MAKSVEGLIGSQAVYRLWVRVPPVAEVFLLLSIYRQQRK